jgi:Tol biopolymer transport system component
VAVTAGETAQTTFDVTCGQLFGSIELTTTTTGIGLDGDGYQVTIDGTAAGTVGINETVVLSDVPVGDRSVELQGIAGTCSATSANPETVTVAEGGTSPVAFDLFCFRNLSDELVFVSERDGNPQLYFMAADGSQQTNLSNDPADDRNPTLAPDGSAVVFESNRSGNFDIWRLSASGFTNLTNSASSEREPSFAGNLGGIAYARQGSLTWQIWRININGTTPGQLTGDLGNDRSPEYSADGSLILFESDRDGNLEVYVMDADGSNQTNLTNDADVDGRPAWSPDGTKIAFVSDRSGNFEVWVADFDAGTKTISNLVNVSNDPANDYMPVWNGAGTQIAFASDRTGNFEIWRMNADGSSQVNLSNSAGADDDQPVWSN